MKKFILSFAVLLIACIVSCNNKNDEIFKTKDELAPEVVKKWFESYKIKYDNKRVAGNRFENLEPNWDVAKEQVTNSGAKCLEIPLKFSKRTRWMYNLGEDGKEELQVSTPKFCMVVYLEKDERVVTIKEIRPSNEYYRKYKSRIYKDRFSGKVFVWNWSGELIGGSFYENGKRLGSISPIKSNESLRIAGVVCNTYTDCAWSATCFQNGTNEFIYFRTTTFSSGSSCFPPDNNNHGGGVFGCTGWEKTSSNSYTQCYNTTDPEGPGDGEGSGPGEVDTFQGFPTNPTDGQQVTYTNPSGNSTTFTYHGNLRLWMMPEVLALKNQGVYFQFPWGGAVPNHLSGSILTAYALPLVIEPTPIGKAILVSAGIIYAGLYIYNNTSLVMDYLRDTDDFEHCIRLYQTCVNNKPFLNCGTCYSYCLVQGEWDFYNCPNIHLAQ